MPRKSNPMSSLEAVSDLEEYLSLLNGRLEALEKHQRRTEMRVTLVERQLNQQAKSRKGDGK